MVNVSVYPNIMETHTSIADRSAFLVLIVTSLRHACKENVLTRALEHVDKMPYAKW